MDKLLNDSIQEKSHYLVQQLFEIEQLRSRLEERTADDRLALEEMRKQWQDISIQLLKEEDKKNIIKLKKEKEMLLVKIQALEQSTDGAVKKIIRDRLIDIKEDILACESEYQEFVKTLDNKRNEITNARKRLNEEERHINDMQMKHEHFKAYSLITTLARKYDIPEYLSILKW